MERVRQYLGNLIGILWVCGFVLYLLISGIHEWRIREYLSKNGVTAQVTVLDNSTKARDYWVKYYFYAEMRDGTRRAIIVTERTNPLWGLGLPHYEPDTVLYDPAELTLARLARNNNHIVTLGGVVCLGIGLPWFIMLMSRVGRTSVRD